jgi:hypothetical protein
MEELQNRNNYERESEGAKVDDDRRKLHSGGDKEIADCLIFTLLSAISNAKGHASPRIGRCTWDHALGPYALVVCRRLPVAAETWGRTRQRQSRRPVFSLRRKRTKTQKAKANANSRKQSSNSSTAVGSRFGRPDFPTAHRCRNFTNVYISLRSWHDRASN